MTLQAVRSKSDTSAFAFHPGVRLRTNSNASASFLPLFILVCASLHAADTVSLKPDAFLSRYCDQACADCHAKIDPLGFALEAYDPIGQHRNAYPNGAAIDTTGE